MLMQIFTSQLHDNHVSIFTQSSASDVLLSLTGVLFEFDVDPGAAL